MSLRKRVAALEQDRLDRSLARHFTPAHDADVYPVALRVEAVREIGDLGEIKYAAAVANNGRIVWQDARLVDDEDAAKRIARARIDRSLANIFWGTK